MAEERLSSPAMHRTQWGSSVRKIREVLRLEHVVALSNRAISRVCGISNSTIANYSYRS